MQCMNYSPKAQFGPMLEFVLNEARFFDELQSRCVDLCILAKYPGRSNALKATAKELDVSFSPKLFTRKRFAIAHIRTCVYTRLRVALLSAQCVVSHAQAYNTQFAAKYLSCQHNTAKTT